jgi:DNA-binding transcriptional MerR regulator
MNHFTIKDIENLCGIKAHTLRTWEQRYNFFTPKRKQSKHRIYDDNDLKELLRISFLYHNGYKVSRIAELTPGQIHDLVECSCKNTVNETYVHQLLEASIDFDKDKFEKIINNLVVRIGLEKCILQVFLPFLERMGLLWMTNHVIPAQEHFSSHIIRKKIICGIDGLEPAHSPDHTILIFAPEGEYHEIPLLIANYFFKKQGVPTVYFGVNVSLDTIAYYCENRSVTHFYSHIITRLDNCALEKFICTLSSMYPGKKIIISGAACKCVGKEPQNLQKLHCVEELITAAQQLSDT